MLREIVTFFGAPRNRTIPALRPDVPAAERQKTEWQSLGDQVVSLLDAAEAGQTARSTFEKATWPGRSRRSP